MALPCADAFIALYAIPFEYACGSVVVRKRPSYPLELDLVHVAGQASTAEDEGVVCCERQRYWASLMRSGILHLDAGRVV